MVGGVSSGVGQESTSSDMARDSESGKLPLLSVDELLRQDDVFRVGRARCSRGRGPLSWANDWDDFRASKRGTATEEELRDSDDRQRSVSLVSSAPSARSKVLSMLY